MTTVNRSAIVPYSAAQMYALVMEIERYPEFLPWCTGCRILQRDGNVWLSEMSVGYKIFRERFKTRVRFVENAEVHVEYIDGPMKHLKNDWIFRPAVPDHLSGGSVAPGGCEIDFSIDFEFRSRLLETIAQGFFDRALGRMMDAFEERARALYS